MAILPIGSVFLMYFTVDLKFCFHRCKMIRCIIFNEVSCPPIFILERIEVSVFSSESPLFIHMPNYSTVYGKYLHAATAEACVVAAI